jgi:membrane-bound lytic murein transglycosylase D
MRKVFVILGVLSPMFLFLIGGCAASSASMRPASANSKTQKSATRDPGGLSEREKWNLARDAYKQACKKQDQKDSEAASYYFEVALELLGSLDMGAIEIPTQRVLRFQRQVLQSYDKFLATVDKLPASTLPMAVLDVSTPDDTTGGELFDKSAEDRDTKPVPILSNGRRLADVPVAMNSRVADQLNFFMNKGRKVMLAWMDRSTDLFPRLRPILQEEGIPEDLLFLAMIESGLNPRARSYAHAAGIWQFIQGTGKIYGLNIDRFYDERYHVEEATRAACRYLRKLYDEFDDWYLAMAAYNCGEMRIEREIVRGHTRDYWRMNRLPRQTRSYVPAYLATREIYKNPTQYGFPPLPREVPYHCEYAVVNGSYRLEHIARAAGADPDWVLDNNPEFLRGMTPGGQVKVRLPRKDAAFESRLATLPQTVVKPNRTHRVKAGETIQSIARKYDVTVQAIMSLPENRRVKPNRLRGGQTIVIPVMDTPLVADNATDSPKKAAADTTNGAVTPPPVVEHEIVYTVHDGETLGRIGRQLGVSVDEICRQNKIADPDLIAPGRKLRIHVSGGDASVAQKPAPDDSTKVAQNPDAKSRTYKVQPGDTIWSIARTVGQDPRKILSWNKLENGGTIFPGQELIVSQE